MRDSLTSSSLTFPMRPGSILLNFSSIYASVTWLIDEILDSFKLDGMDSRIFVSSFGSYEDDLFSTGLECSVMLKNPLSSSSIRLAYLDN